METCMERKEKKHEKGCGESLEKGFGKDSGEEIVIKVENLSKQFGKTEVLHEVNISFAKGRIHGLIGEIDGREYACYQWREERSQYHNKD